MRKLIALVIGCGLGIVFGLTPFALADHATIQNCFVAGKQQSAIFEPDQHNRDGVKSDINVIDPYPNVKTAIVRSMYLWKSAADLVEFGWKWTADPSYLSPGETLDTSPRVFAVRVLNGNYSILDTGGGPGAGMVGQGTTHAFKIVRNPAGGQPNLFKMYRDGDFAYDWINGNMGVDGGQPAIGNEAFGPCEDMEEHAWNIQKQNAQGGPWTNWTGLFQKSDFNFNTKWWYTVRDETPPEWWVKHCTSAWCNDQTQ